MGGEGGCWKGVEHDRVAFNPNYNTIELIYIIVSRYLDTYVSSYSPVLPMVTAFSSGWWSLEWVAEFEVSG